MKGWVKLDRSLEEWKHFKKIKYRAVWIEMLFRATIKDVVKNGVEIKRGELIFSYRSWTEKFKGEITKQNLETIIRNLKNDQKISMKHVESKKMTVITILNYDNYISLDDEQKKDIDAIKTKTVEQGVSRHLDIKTKTVDRTDYKKEEQLEMPCMIEDDPFPSPTKDIDQDTNQDSPVKNQDSSDEKSRPLKRINNKNKKELINYLSKYPKKFLNLTEKIIDAMNKYLSQGNFKTFDPLDEKNVLKMIYPVYKQGNKNLEDYIKIIDYKYKQWNGKTYQDGNLKMLNFTPLTLFKRYFDRYLREAENFANRDPFNDNKSEFDLYCEQLLKEEDEKKQLAKRQKKEAQKQHSKNLTKELLEKLKKEDELKKSGKLLSF